MTAGFVAEAPPVTARTARRRFACEAVSVRRARHWVATVLEDWELTTVNEHVELLVSELASNAVIHARSSFEVDLNYDGEALRCSVADDSPEPPRRVHFAADDLGGRGFAIVQILSDASGVDTGGSSKVVWFDMAVPHGA